MTLEEARREINKANSKLYRLYQSEFKKGTPASKVLEKNLRKLGLKLTPKGYISTKGANFQKVIGAGRQAQIFTSSLTSTAQGAKKDIANRLGTWTEKIQVTPEQAKAVWKIFKRSNYKKASETVGSDPLIFLATRFTQAQADKPAYKQKSVGLYIQRRAEEYLKGNLTEDELLFGDLDTAKLIAEKSKGKLEELTDEEVEAMLNDFYESEEDF